MIMHTKGSILVGLLWCIALLAVIVVGVLHTGRIDLMIVKNQGDLIQAHYLALAGAEKAKALLYHDAVARRGSANNHSGELYDAPEQFRDVPFGRGQFRVFRQGRADEAGRIIYGISDEESRLHANQASASELGRLPGMTTPVLSAIMDWRDSDNAVSQNGAESEHYASLQPPYVPRNGPFDTMRELLMVAGVTRDLLLGEDANHNGLLDPEENDGAASYPPDNRDGILDAGWAGMLTIDSSVENLDAAGQERIDIQSADEKSLSSVPGISADLAKAIIAHRNQNRFRTIADLLDVTAANQTQGQPRPPNVPGGSAQVPGFAPASASASARPAGPKLISEELLMDIADQVTTATEEEQIGIININTASPIVLACLPGIDQQLAEAIVAHRKSAGFFPNVAGILKVDGMTPQIFKQMVQRITVRSETFRILSEGRVGSTGARKRIETIVRVSSGSVDTLSFREDL